MPDSQVWLVTGCSSGIGKDIVLAALAAGHKVVATARNVSALKDVEVKGAHVLHLDVTAPSSELSKTVDQALGVCGHIDVLVNNAGQIMFGTIEETSEEDVDRLFKVNSFGAINLIRLILPHMRNRKSGTIINVGSGAGTTGHAAIASYVGTKFALNGKSSRRPIQFTQLHLRFAGYTESLNSEVRHLGIRAMYLEVGDFRTGILDPVRANSPAAIKAYPAPQKVKMLRASGSIPEYYGSGTAATSVESWFAAKTGKQSGDPKKAAEVIVRVASGGDERGVPQRLALGADVVADARKKIQYLLENLETWEEVSSSTDF
ncbi:short-chain oxidoreductase [Heliocybe sulcata]|uniref:Short-chain oxidoreductase n=1 Tax=Heliocybe sulcata TaxID=5364 RepID=A0A5C3N1U1_9AGAM|nr:short-chain oxidoreductase [Heliocybe sulcata]